MPKPKASTKVVNSRCACGCGLYVPEERLLYYSDACVHRVAQRRYRAKCRQQREAVQD